MFQRMAARLVSSVPDVLPRDMQDVLDRNEGVDWEYVEGYFDNTPEGEQDAASLEEYMSVYSWHESATRLADEANMDELGMSAEYGQDEDSTATHTDLEEEDLETTETRPLVGSACGSPGCQCGPDCQCVAEGACPGCHGDLVKLEGWY